MKINLYQLSKDQITLFKGVAILLIVLHNYVHLISGVTENELLYNAGVVKKFITSLQYPDRIFNSLISFLGHYGVQIFIFCSGYGLTKKYKAADKINYRKYIIPQAVKIYGLLITGLLFTVAVRINTFNGEAVRAIINNLLMINTFSYKTIFEYVGPFWFFGLILQLYLLYPFLLRIIRKYNTPLQFILILTIVYVTIYALFPITQSLNIPLFGNFLGHLPEFLLGIWLATNPKINLNSKLLIGSIIVFIASNLSVHLFPFSFLSITVILLFISYPVLRLPKSSIVFKGLQFIGIMSMFMFITNGPLRMVSFKLFDCNMNSLPLYITLTAFLHLLIVIILSYITSLIYKCTVDPLSNKIIQKLIR